MLSLQIEVARRDPSVDADAVITRVVAIVKYLRALLELRHPPFLIVDVFLNESSVRVAFLDARSVAVVDVALDEVTDIAVAIVP